ncbi:MAG: UbiA family prenyltransferase, partial [Deltaproteobacteria bacterium]|nr:UbiA family prenyltransferase [Deltaproteobacteria bacterium]
VIGVILLRSAGCVINDYIDRDIDPHVERTRNRPLAARLIDPREALALAAALLLLAFGLVLHLNALTVMLSFVALALAVIYPLLKRFFAFPQHECSSHNLIAFDCRSLAMPSYVIRIWYGLIFHSAAQFNTPCGTATLMIKSTVAIPESRMF